MLDLIPLTRARRVVANGDRYLQPIGQSLQMDFLGAQSRAIATAGIRADQHASRLRVGFPSHQPPPSANAGHGKFRRVMGDTLGRDMLVSRAKRLTAPRPCSSAF